LSSQIDIKFIITRWILWNRKRSFYYNYARTHIVLK